MGLLRGLFSKQRPEPALLHPFNPEYPLLYFSDSDHWRVMDAFEGVQIFGATGSGKSSGSGQAIAKAFLCAGFGGLVLTAKPDERNMWLNYARQTGREKDIVVFSPSQPWKCNFLDYELRRPGTGRGLTANIVNLFCHVIETAESKASGGHNDRYWISQLEYLLTNATDLMVLAEGKLSLRGLYDIVNSAPQCSEQIHDPGWQSRSYCYACFVKADQRSKTPQQQHDFNLTADYWLNEFPQLDAEPRSVIKSMFTGMATRFLRGALYPLFCTETNIEPDDTYRSGIIILLDLPVKDFMKVGQTAQILFKYIFQQAVERRDVAQFPRPVFLWADEAQNFISSYDMRFQETARSSRACTVYLTQNLSNYYKEMGGEAGKAAVDSLLGNLQTKIFHANGDAVTNSWAAEQIGKMWQTKINPGMSQRDRAGGFADSQYNSNFNSSRSVEYDILPREFTTLQKGGPPDFCAEAIIFQGGRVWQAEDKTWMKLAFNQEI